MITDMTKPLSRGWDRQSIQPSQARPMKLIRYLVTPTDTGRGYILQICNVSNAQWCFCGTIAKGMTWLTEYYVAAVRKPAEALRIL